MSPEATARSVLLGGDGPPGGRDDLERAFFAGLRLPNGVFKTTWTQRLQDLNEALARHLPEGGSLELMDVAVSSGVSTAEWAESLSALGRDHHLVAGDLTMSADLVGLPGGVDVLLTRSGALLQVDVRGRRRLTTESTLARRLTRAVIGLWCRALVGSPRLARSSGASCVRVPLLSARVAARTDIEWIDDDILGRPDPGLAGRFHAVRAANILNLGYFPAPVLITGLRNLRTRLRPGGVLAVVRTDGDANHGSILRLDESGSFTVLDRVGDGSEVEGLALSLAPD